MAAVLSPPPEQGQLVSVRERRFIVTDVARGTLPDSPLRPSGNGAQHLVSLSSVEDDALGEELQVFWELEPGAKVIEKVALPDVASCASLYYWPHEKRDKTASGTIGKLHVKCVAADSEWLFLSSANLTEHAFTINMELGLLIHGGHLPKQIEQHFDRLIAKKMLISV